MIVVGIDIGGTFTDVVIFNLEKGEFLGRFKVLSTPRDPLKGVKNALEELKKIVDNVNLIVHATTIATNTLLGQKGLEIPKTVLLTTKGFRDVLEIGRQKRPEIYDLYFEKPRVLVPRKYRLEIKERTLPNGEILEKPSRKEIERVAEFIRHEGAVSVAISFINSYVNPSNEETVAKIIRELLPEVYMSASSRIDRQYREYERTSTTVINAILQPIVSRYISRLQGLAENYFGDAKVVIMKSDGGIGDARYVAERPVSIIESGPAAGVVAAKYLGSLLGIENIISFDMGGTTAKAGIIHNGKISVISEYEVGGKIHAGRIIKGSGYPVRYPFIDLAEVSAGGGSIVWVDEAGGLKVGPKSAGSDPGPACYGRGGKNPTITDAHLILNRISEDSFLGGKFRVFRSLAVEAFAGLDLDMDVEDVAIGAVKIANFIMSKVLRIVTVERGLDPRRFTLLAFGGGGPLHACALAEEVGFSRVVFPIFPGVFSALGLVATEFKYSDLEPIMGLLSEDTLEKIYSAFDSMLSRATRYFLDLGIGSDRLVFSYFLDVRYEGQGYELLVGVSPRPSLQEVGERFEALHEALYGFRDPSDIEIINARIEVITTLRNFRLKEIKRGGREDPSDARVGERSVYFECYDDYLVAPVYDRGRLRGGDIVNGPAIIEDYDSTIIIDPLWRGVVDRYGNIELERR